MIRKPADLLLFLSVLSSIAIAQPTYYIEQIFPIAHTLAGFNSSNQQAGYIPVPTPVGNSNHAFFFQPPNDFRDLGSFGGVPEIPSYSIATSINEAGQVVGHSIADDGRFHGFLYDPVTREMRDLDPLMPVPHALPAKINDSGQILLNANEMAFLLTQSTIRELVVPGARHIAAKDLNNAGQVLYSVSFEGGLTRPVIVNPDGTIVEVPVVNSNRIPLANAINDLGHVVGQVSFGDPPHHMTHGFLLRDGQVIDLGAPVLASTAKDINNLDQIVGQAIDNNNTHTGVLWTGGTMYMLDDLVADRQGRTFHDPIHIDDDGRILTGSLDFTGSDYRYVILSPVPEPMGIGALFLAVGLLNQRPTARRI